MSKCILALTAMAMLMAAPAHAAEGDSAQFVAMCRASQGDPKQKADTLKLFEGMQCLRYIEGFKEGLAAAGGAPRFCIPAKSPLGDQVVAYVKWADAHPDMLTQPKEATVLKALGEIYPCGK